MALFFPNLCAADERMYKRVLRLIPAQTSVNASFYKWPPLESECPDGTVSRFFRSRISQSPQKSICFAATFLSQFMADRLGPTTDDSPFAFAFAGAISLLALDISNRPTRSLDIVFQGDIRVLMAHMFQCSRFILPSQPLYCETSLQLFLKVGPEQGDITLSQNDIIYVEIFLMGTGAIPFRDRWAEPVMRYHETALIVRTLNPLSLLKSKLHMYAHFRLKHDWTDICDIVQAYHKRIPFEYLEADSVRTFFEKPPEGLTVPESWPYIYAKKRRRRRTNWFLT